MTNRLKLLVMLALLLFPCSARASNGSTATEEYAGREYLLYTPKQVSGRAPLLIVLHGGGGHDSWMQRQLDLDSTADKNGFRVAYLNGTGADAFIARNLRTWNAGSCCGPAVKHQIDDVGFLAGFITMISGKGVADPARITMMGHSNGGMMTYSFACTHSNMLAAAVAVSSTVGIERCAAPGLPLLHVHGMADENVPIAGGTGKKSVTGDVTFQPVATSDAFMTRAGAQVQTILLPDTPHKLSTVSENMRKQKGISLEDMIAQFMRGKTNAR